MGFAHDDVGFHSRGGRFERSIGGTFAITHNANPLTLKLIA